MIPLPPFQELLSADSLGPWVRVLLGTEDSIQLYDTAIVKFATGWDTLVPGTVIRVRRSLALPPKGVCGVRGDTQGIWVGRTLAAARSFRKGFFFDLEKSCRDTLWIPRPRAALWQVGDSLVWHGPLDILPWNGSGRRGVATSTGIYPGKISLQASNPGILVINHVPLEIYLEGVLLAEMGIKFPIEALKAQAVAARTYALATLMDQPLFRPYHLYGDTRHQAYDGSPPPPKIREAVRETRGEVLMDGDSLATVFYHANCGGVLADGEDVFGVDRPYLHARPDVWKGVVVCEYATREVEDLRWFGKRERWHAFVPRSWFERVFGIGKFQSIMVGRGPSGRVNRLEIQGSKDRRVIEKQSVIRQFLGKPLPSTLFGIKETPQGIWLIGWGYGHGVGMCQVGAGGMAALGASYREILEHYYPGLRIAKLW